MTDKSKGRKDPAAESAEGQGVNHFDAWLADAKKKGDRSNIDTQYLNVTKCASIPLVLPVFEEQSITDSDYARI